ncbi:hypothetical protein ACFX2C_025548 [Malus domestica]
MSCRLAVEANLPSITLCRRLQLRIEELKKSDHKDLEKVNVSEDRCSESDTEGSGHLSDLTYNACCSSEIRKSSSSRSVFIQCGKVKR